MSDFALRPNLEIDKNDNECCLFKYSQGRFVSVYFVTRQLPIFILSLFVQSDRSLSAPFNIEIHTHKIEGVLGLRHFLSSHAQNEFESIQAARKSFISPIPVQLDTHYCLVSDAI